MRVIVSEFEKALVQTGIKSSKAIKYICTRTRDLNKAVVVWFSEQKQMNTVWSIHQQIHDFEDRLQMSQDERNITFISYGEQSNL